MRKWTSPETTPNTNERWEYNLTSRFKSSLISILLHNFGQGRGNFKMWANFELSTHSNLIELN